MKRRGGGHLINLTKQPIIKSYPQNDVWSRSAPDSIEQQTVVLLGYCFVMNWSWLVWKIVLNTG